MKIAVFQLDNVIAQLAPLDFIEGRKLPLFVSSVVEELLDGHILVVITVHAPCVHCFVNLTESPFTCMMENLIATAKVWVLWVRFLLGFVFWLVALVRLTDLVHEILLLFEQLIVIHFLGLTREVGKHHIQFLADLMLIVGPTKTHSKQLDHLLEKLDLLLVLTVLELL